MIALRPRHLVAISVLAVAMLLFGTAGAAEAQQLLPKRALPAVGAQGCAPAPRPMDPRPETRDQVRTLLVQAQQAVLADERPAATALLAEAARLDPADPEVAYHHARLLEEMGDAAGAASEFCRFLALAPESADAADVWQRLAVLAAAVPNPGLSPEVVEQFANGIVYLDRADYRAAIRAFTFVLHHHPELAEAHFNRGLAHLGARRSNLATQDLEAYLSLSPDAPDRGAVLQRLQVALRPPTTSPQNVLVRGMLVPGLGQFTTQRPFPGALVILTAGSALALGFQSRDVERTITFLDPFNNPREYVRLESERPYLGVGVATALAVTALGALEAYLHVQRKGGGEPSPLARQGRTLRPLINPSEQGLEVGVSLSGLLHR